MNNRALLWTILRPWLVLALVCGGFSLHPNFRETFWTADYLPNILQQAATNIILAVGLTFVILGGGIDLSVGSVLALCGVVLGLACNRGMPLETALLVAVATGALCGAVNGALVAWARVPAFVVTLGMMTAARGLTLFVTGGVGPSNLPKLLGALGEGLPLVTVTLAVAVCGVVLQAATVWGRHVTAVGANDTAARLAGIGVEKTRLLTYVVSGVTAALAAIVLTAKFQVADTGAAAGAELNAIAACVIGGCSLSGGRGSVLGSVIGALTIAVLNAGLVLVSVPDTLQGVVIGVVIVLIVMVDQLKKGTKS